MEMSARLPAAKLKTPAVTLLAAAFLASCSSGPNEPMRVTAEKPFVSAGSIELQLDGGNYQIHAADGDRIRISFGGNTGNATAELNTTGNHANLVVKDTPHTNFKAIIEVPKTSDVVLRLTGGNLEMAALTGNKDIDSQAGNAEIAVGTPNDYASVDASVKVGNLDAGPFGQSEAGLSHHVTWSGPGKYKLRASLGAGNLELQAK